MGNAYTSNAALYLVDVLFGLYMMLVLLRLLLQLVRADFYNPVSQFLVRATNPPLKPLRRIIPGWAGIDLASVVLLIALQCTALALSHLIIGRNIDPTSLFVLATAELINLTLTVYLITIIAQAILSWVGPATHNPVSGLLYSINEPVLRPFRRFIPAISGIDLSPLVAIITIQLLKFLLVAPISDLGKELGRAAGYS